MLVIVVVPLVGLCHFFLLNIHSCISIFLREKSVHVTPVGLIYFWLQKWAYQSFLFHGKGIGSGMGQGGPLPELLLEQLGEETFSFHWRFEMG